MYPAGAVGLTTRYVTLPDGVTVRTVAGGDESAAGGVVLVHGWGGCLYSYAEMLPALMAAGHRVLAIDLPGYGLSDKPHDARKYTTQYMSEVVALITERAGIRTFAFVGHSLGGRVGLEEAIRGAPGLERLVLINPVGLGVVPIVRPLRLFSPRLVDAFTPAVVTRGLIRAILEVAFATDHRPTSRDIEEYWAPSQYPEYAWACRATLHRASWERLPAAALRGLRLPVLVITGGRDRLVRRVAGRASQIPGVRTLHVPEGGHIVMQECSDRVNAEILSFLAG